MKILVFKQPFPMGNYLLNQIVANNFTRNGHEVYLVDQFNISLSNTDKNSLKSVIDETSSLDFDAVYYEMLDEVTFEIVKNLKCKNRILLCASGGIWGVDNLLDKVVKNKGIYFDKIMTNSLELYNHLQKNKIPSENFQYYFSPIEKKEVDPKYQKNCVFLGMGFHRKFSEDYELERDLFFNNPEVSIYGNGWDGFKNWVGVLPPGDISNLYSSANSAVAIIGKGQRSLGMINNRYSEIMSCGCRLITYNYPNIDWFGADKFMEFIDTSGHLEEIIRNPQKEIDPEKSIKFMNNQNKKFFEKLNNLIFDNSPH